MKTRRTVCHGIEPAENGWVVTETVFIEPEAVPISDESDDDGEGDGPGYDPSAAFAQATEQATGTTVATRDTKVYVFGTADHAKMIQFINDRTRPSG